MICDVVAVATMGIVQVGCMVYKMGKMDLHAAFDQHTCFPALTLETDTW